MYVCMYVFMHTMFSICDPASQQGQRSEAVSHYPFPRILIPGMNFGLVLDIKVLVGSLKLGWHIVPYLSIYLSNLNPILSYFISVYFVVSCFILSHFLLSYLSLSYIHCICTLLILFYLILVNYFLPDPIYNYIYLILSYFSYHIYLSNYRSVDLSIYLSI